MTDIVKEIADSIQSHCACATTRSSSMGTAIEHSTRSRLTSHAKDHKALDDITLYNVHPIHNIVHRHRFTINHVRAKTEILFTRTHFGARKYRQSLHTTELCLPIPPPEHYPAPQAHLCTTSRSNHVGATVHPSNSMRYEIRKRAARGRAAATHIQLATLRAMSVKHATLRIMDPKNAHTI